MAALLALVVLASGAWIANGGSSTAPRPLAGDGTGSNPTASGPVSSGPTSTPIPSNSTPGKQPGVVAQPAGLRLSAGRAQEPAVPVAVVNGRPLGTPRITAILDRLPAWTGDSVLARSFKWPTQSIKTPQAGKTVPLGFPATGSGTKPDPTPTGPLHVLRMQPQGSVSIAPFISITFDQPMVAVTTVGQLAAAQVPATITPKVAGSWQWIGTSTLRFAAGRSSATDLDRLPMATDFTVTVPAATRAAGGAKLAATESFSFSTPAPTVRSFAPTGNSLALNPMFVAVFDQRVDPKAVLGKVTLSAGGTVWPVRVATVAEIAADTTAFGTISAAPVGRVVAFRPVRALPVDAAVTVTFAAGTPSAEGPRTTTAPATYSGRTYAALTLVKSECGYGDCQPSTPLTLTFNNSLDPKSFDPRTIRVSPAIPGGASVTATGQQIYVQGNTQPDTTYTVTAPTTLTDVYGQKLAAPAVATVHIGPATPRLDPFTQPITTLDPMVSAPSITVNTLNRNEFRERVFEVSPQDWPTYQGFYVRAAQQNFQQSAVLTVPGWPVLVDRVVTIDGPKNVLVSTKLDLSKVMPTPEKTSHVVVLIEPTSKESFDNNNIWQNRPTMTWAQSTVLGLDAFNDATQLRTWVTDLRDGSPQSGVTVGLVGSDGRIDPRSAATTSTDGIAPLALTAGGAGALLATRGTQSALLPSAMWNNNWTTSPSTDHLLWFVNDDRQTYRPTETVSVKGWVRRQESNVTAALKSIPEGTVSYTVQDAYGVSIGHGTVKVSGLGGFDLTVKIPAGANLGSAGIQLHLAGASVVDSYDYSLPFTIAEFRTPAFQVDSHIDGTVPAVIGNALTVAADATYYAGGPLGAAPVDWQVRTAAATYAPPGWGQFTFGIWTPWWQTDSGFGSGRGGMPSGNCCQPVDPDAVKVDKFSGTTDAGGSNYLQVEVGNLGDKFAGLPVTLTAQATVTDVNRQAIAGTADVLVHPADYYVGLSSDETFVTQGKDLVVQAIATDIDGKAAPGRSIRMQAAKVTTSYANGVPVDTESDQQPCQVTSTAGPVTCTFHPSAAGTYRITGTVVDDKGRTSRSQLTRWVAGADGSVDNSVQQQQLTLVPDKKEYQPGESAKLLVQSPIRAGSGLITLQHNGIVSTTRFAVTNGSAVVNIPITEAEIPGVTVSIEVVGTAPRSASNTQATGTVAAGTPRPAYATGEIGLTVSTLARTLKVTAVPRQRTVVPGGTTTVDVTVTDQSGKPMAGSEFEVVVADEAVLALGGYTLPDPIKAFYPELPSMLNAFYGRSTVMLADPLPPLKSAGSAAASSAAMASGAPMPASAPGTDAYSTTPTASASAAGANGAVREAAQSSTGAPIAERKNFDALALFVPKATTDAGGHATIQVPLPDSLTRYRVMVVAVAGDNRFGSTDSTITAALPLTVRPSAPTFLNFGDKLELPVLLQNQTGAPLTTDVVIQAANLKIDGPAGQQVTVPANGRIEVRFPVSADQAGTAKFRIAAVSGTAADSATIELPVYTPTTTETFASYGVINGGDTLLQKVTAPKGVVGQFGGLQVSTSSTALQQLTDAVGYLADYDYDSSDGLAGQIIAIGSLADVLKAFSAPGLPSADGLRALVVGDVVKLSALQNSDGGFPYWKQGDKSDPFNSIQSTQALLVAAKNGFAVSKNALAKAQQYLGNIGAYIPADASQATRDTLRAYALNVRMVGGQRDSAAAQALVTERGANLPLDAVAWLLPVTDGTSRASLVRLIGNAAVDDAGSATFTNKVTDDAWTTLQSDRRTDGLILDALITVDPKSDLIPKVVAGVMAGQTSGRWDNVQENAFILLALRHYYDAFESTSADFVAGVWLGDRFAGQHTFSGHTTERATLMIPTADLVAADNSDVTLNNAGTGRLYYRLGLQTAPTNLQLAPLDRGFVVSRTYTGADNPADVTRDTAGTWHIKAGARVRVQLALVSRSAQTHVALIDPLPAGLQILNPDLATTPKDLDPAAAAKAGVTASQNWYSTWYDHQNLRDDRAEAFATYLQGGVYQYSYLASATTDGTFVAPPTRAEQVYAPETFGRGGSDRVVIES
ncbi:uncharacterized protein YfaS (alpha-2-macroglobulin family) [Nakamurella sp. UYEF19]|uniref:alpha-2-macroglobulin family protein n=1 Tax=Nakamurella sp. UYEF19 TaxID=1756392 RepID=UPI003398FD62